MKNIGIKFYSLFPSLVFFLLVLAKSAMAFNDDTTVPSPAVRSDEQLQPLTEFRNVGSELSGEIVQGSVLRSQAVAPPTNDACGSATPLVVNAGCVNGTTDQGSVQAGEVLQPSCAQTAFTQTVWYSFVATSTTMFVQLNTTGTFFGNGGTWYPNNWASAVYSPGGCPPAASRLINCQYHSSVGTNDGIIVNMLSGLTVNATYLVQVGYAQPTGGGPSGVVPQFCIRVGDRFTPVCNRCTSACGPACGFTTAPTVAQVTSTCPAYNQTPFLEGSVADTQCYTFFARNTTVSFNVILNSTCSAGNVANFTWTLHGPNGCTTVQSGNLNNLTFTNLAINQQYTYCYSFSVPADCYHTAYWPYFVGASPLPIELAMFTAQPENGRIRLDWSTASEINNDYFTIERSRNGVDFEVVNQRKGAGNSSEEINYVFVDEKPYPGTSYYRLKQTDFDGTFTYSDIVSVRLTGENTDFLLYPNPAQGSVTLLCSSALSGQCTLKVRDISGREIITRELDLDKRISEIELDLHELHTGLYYVILQTPAGLTTRRLARQ